MNNSKLCLYLFNICSGKYKFRYTFRDLSLIYFGSLKNSDFVNTGINEA